MQPAPTQFDHAHHTPISDPGRHRNLFAAMPTDPDGLSAIARNVIVHYRASGHELPEASRDDINARWLEAILDVDQSRHRGALHEPRPELERVQGCCRDHTLFCVGALREHGIPARSRVGFAGYFIDGWHHDHVIVEAWMGDRWRRFDAEVDAPRTGLESPMNLDFDEVGGRGFVTAAQVWAAHRRGDVDTEIYGVDPNLPGFRGERFVFDEVIFEIAHRFGDELLLWDFWGRIGPPEAPVTEADAAWLDPIAALLLASDAGDIDAETALLDQYRSDPGLHPGTTIGQASPYGDPPIEVDLTALRGMS